jgi:hypothetical protein
VPRPATTKRPPRKLPESQSKFDRWLETQVEQRRSVTFIFSEHPRAWQVNTGRVELDCKVIAVDRYMLLLEFHDGQTWWTSKANILSAG